MERIVSSRKTYLPAVLACLALVLLLAAATSGLAASPQVVSLRVVGPAAPVLPGQTFAVSIYADNAQNLGSFEFDFVFDAAVAATDSSRISLGAFLGSSGRNTGELRRDPSPPDANRAIFGAYSYGSQDGPAGNGLIATAAMTAAGAGSSDLVLENVQVTDISAKLLASTVQNGSVQVAGQVHSYPLFLPVLLRRG